VSGRKVTAHELVYKTARSMANELFDEVMSGDNALYSGWKEAQEKTGKSSAEMREIFVDLVCPKLLEPARAILAHMLSDKAYEHLHEAIYTSMLLDNSIRASRVLPAGRPKLDAATGKVTYSRRG
jgi:hypothetical protein